VHADTIRRMTERDSASAAAEVAINAAPDTVYQLITDLNTLASLAEENEAMSWHKGEKASPGAVFRGTNRNGSHKWTTTCTVTDAEPGRAFAFDVKYMALPIAHWRYDIVPDGAGCRVTEQTWDRRPGWFSKTAWIGTGVRDRDGANAKHIKLTLQRLKAKAETG
jgi:hypothetical protein